MEVKLGVHVFYIVSMTTTTTKSLRNFSIITSPLLQLANGTTHGRDAWCACVLHRFHDNHNNKRPQELHYSNSLTVPHMEMKLGTHVYYIIFMTTTCFYDDCSNSFWHFSSNLLTAAHMEMKLGQKAHDIVSMTTTSYLDNNK